MPRKQSVIIFPHLNDCNGDLSKQWYVEYKWRIPGEERPRKERIYKGLSKGTAEDRRKIAGKIIKEKTQWLKSGEQFNGMLLKSMKMNCCIEMKQNCTVKLAVQSLQLGAI